MYFLSLPRESRLNIIHYLKYHKWVSNKCFYLIFQVLEEIFTFLSAADILSLSQTCKFLNQITEHDKVWAPVCRNFGIKLRSSGGYAKKFYKNGRRSLDKNNSLTISQIFIWILSSSAQVW